MFNKFEYLSKLNEKYGKIEEIVFEEESFSSIIIEPSALVDIENFFHIGASHPSSLFEQQMSLFGFKDENTYYIKYAYPSYLKNRYKNMGKVDKETISNSLEELKIIRENISISDDKNDYMKNLTFLGYIHSRPLDESFEFGKGDFNLLKCLTNKFKDGIHIIVNPTNLNMKAISGKNEEKTSITIYKKKKAKNKKNKDKKK